MSRRKITSRYEGFSSIEDNDYQMKSCIMAGICLARRKKSMRYRRITTLMVALLFILDRVIP